MISIVTPTGDRPQTLAMLGFMMMRNVGKVMLHDVEWIVVDDGETPCEAPGATVLIRLDPLDGPSVARNYLVGLEAASGDVIVYMEDDDWYHEDYLATVVAAFVRGADLVGVSPWRSWHLKERAYREGPVVPSATTSRTAVRRGTALEHHMRYLSVAVENAPGRSEEGRLWASDLRSEVIARPDLCVSMKDVPGRPKLDRFRDRDDLIPDPTAAKLREWLASDPRSFTWYMEFA